MRQSLRRMPSPKSRFLIGSFLSVTALVSFVGLAANRYRAGGESSVKGSAISRAKSSY